MHGQFHKPTLLELNMDQRYLYSQQKAKYMDCYSL